jgi:hypothetical protein
MGTIDEKQANRTKVKEKTKRGAKVRERKVGDGKPIKRINVVNTKLVSNGWFSWISGKHRKREK